MICFRPILKIFFLKALGNLCEKQSRKYVTVPCFRESQSKNTKKKTLIMSKHYFR
jgi:hypothetical protein